MASVPRRPFTEVQDDEAILNFIFSPGSAIFAPSAPRVPATVSEAAGTVDARSQRPATSGDAVVDATAQPARAATDCGAADAFDSEHAEHFGWSARELDAVHAAEAGRLEEAERLMDDIVRGVPSRASAYVNRAQIRRLRGDASGAFSDVCVAVRTASEWRERHPDRTDAIAAANVQALQNAYAHRALCLRELGRVEESDADLHAAAALGSRVAQAMTAQSNPFATMCADTVALMLQSAAASARPASGPACSE